MSSDIWFFASSIMSFDSPSFLDIANALLFPGTPYNNLYVGDSVSSENSNEAFSTPGVEMA